MTIEQKKRKGRRVNERNRKWKGMYKGGCEEKRKEEDETEEKRGEMVKKKEEK